SEVLDLLVLGIGVEFIHDFAIHCASHFVVDFNVRTSSVRTLLPSDICLGEFLLSTLVTGCGAITNNAPLHTFDAVMLELVIRQSGHVLKKLLFSHHTLKYVSHVTSSHGVVAGSSATFKRQISSSNCFSTGA